MKAPEELPGADAFDSFYDRYQRRLRGFLTGFNGDLAVVDDLVQETLVRAYRHAIHLEVGGDPWPWLSRVARNLAADAAKRAPRLHEESGQTERLPTFGVEDPGIARMADQIDVARALGYVSRRQARLLLAFYVHQRDY
ncbi:MAG: RNA polymerase sigma factor, partial [Actinobacteria bacterium]|nr:RNA polymerase sigma factor [Actinomycetota bacterium]